MVRTLLQLAGAATHHTMLRCWTTGLFETLPSCGLQGKRPWGKVTKGAHCEVGGRRAGTAPAHGRRVESGFPEASSAVQTHHSHHKAAARQICGSRSLWPSPRT